MDQRVTTDEIARYRTVVLEGADGVGKSTLADLLVTQMASPQCTHRVRPTIRT